MIVSNQQSADMNPTIAHTDGKAALVDTGDLARAALSGET